MTELNRRWNWTPDELTDAQAALTEILENRVPEPPTAVEIADAWPAIIAALEDRDRLLKVVAELSHPDNAWARLQRQRDAALEDRDRLRARGAGLIATERQRQIDEEGWTADHDDEHTDDELALAAAAYALPEWKRQERNPWPWLWSEWKPSNDRIHELVKAGALIAAEIDRLQRRAALEDHNG